MDFPSTWQAVWFLSKTRHCGRLYIIDVPDGSTWVARNAESLARFITIITPLSNAYGIPKEALHIFTDMSRGLIAFTRDGSIFLNFRYFVAWREFLLIARVACLDG